jgi:amino acid permease
MADGPGLPSGRGPNGGGGASTVSCVANLCNTIVGAGILGLPYALSQCGMALGIGLLLACACACAFSLHLLAVCAQTAAVHPSSFYAVAAIAIPRFTLLIDFAVALKCFGVATSYLIVAGDLLPQVMARLALWQAREPWRPGS